MQALYSIWWASGVTWVYKRTPEGSDGAHARAYGPAAMVWEKHGVRAGRHDACTPETPRLRLGRPQPSSRGTDHDQEGDVTHWAYARELRRCDEEELLELINQLETLLYSTRVRDEGMLHLVEERLYAALTIIERMLDQLTLFD